MKPEISTARVAFVSGCILTVVHLWAGVALAQEDMKGMPGMAPPAAPTPTAKPKQIPEPATPSPKVPTPSSPKQAMDVMPGMAPPPTPTPAAKPKENAEVVTPAPKTPTDSSAKKEMDAMPEMAPAKSTTDKSPTPAGDAMSGMPGMAPTKGPAGRSAAPAKNEMAGMPAMAAGKSAAGQAAGPATKGMAGMPGMAPAGESGPPRQSVPGVTILGPAQKWAPPPGDDRSSELVPRAELEGQLKSLPPPIEDSMPHSFLLFELLEYRAYNAGPATFTWDFVGWVGGDYNRLWIKTEGDLNLRRGNGVQGDLQLLYGRLIAPFWDFQAGVRFNGIMGPGRPRNGRVYGVLGFQGLAPGNFDVEPSLYISDRGEVSAELTISADLYLTQRLVLQPRLEAQASVQGDKQFATAKGMNQTDLGLRLRYEIRKDFSPYIGVSWQRKYGGTASIARSEGEPASAVAFVAGLRVSF